MPKAVSRSTLWPEAGLCYRWSAALQEWFASRHQHVHTMHCFSLGSTVVKLVWLKSPTITPQLSAIAVPLLFAFTALSLSLRSLRQDAVLTSYDQVRAELCSSNHILCPEYYSGLSFLSFTATTLKHTTSTLTCP